MYSLIDGKHPKLVIIDYYDNLISQVDIYVEETLETTKDDEYIVNIEKKEENNEDYGLFHHPIDKRFEDPYSQKYKFDEPMLVESQQGIMVKDFVHSERMNAINEFKQLQKERLEELKLSKTRPTTVEEALFGGKKFGFLIKFDQESHFGSLMKFKLVAVVVDFYLDKNEIAEIFKRIQEMTYIKECLIEIDGEALNEKCLQMYLLSLYLHDQIEHSPTSECVKRVCKKQLYSTEKINLFLTPNLSTLAFDDSIDFIRLKSLRMITEDCEKQVNLNLSGLPNLECLELFECFFDLKQCDPFVNAAKLRQLCLRRCSITNLELDFFAKFSNLEKLNYSASTYCQPSPLKSLTNLKNLKHLILSGGSLDFVEGLEFLKEMTNLVICELDFSINFTIEENTFKELNKLEHLQIHAEKGKWMKYLTNLKSLDFDDLDRWNNEEDVDYFEYLTKLGKLKINYDDQIDVVRSNKFKKLPKLKTLCLSFPIIEIKVNAFAGLDELTELDILCTHEITLLSDSFKGLSNLRKLSVNGARHIDANFLQNFPNLLILQISSILLFKLTERTFSKNTKLKKLEIANCRIETLLDNVFVNLANLTHLSLGGNRIQMFNEAAFNGLDNLIELNLLYAYDRCKFNMNVLTKMPRLKCLFIVPDSKDFLKKLINLHHPNIIQVKIHA